MKRLVLGILAHVDAGKTTLSEALLYQTGQIRSLGRVDHQDAFLDTDQQERERGITIFSKQAVIPMEDMELTLLDTPGHVDFSAEMERALQVVDYAVLVISGTDGVQGHTRTLWRLLKHYQVPTFIFVNKMDLAGADKLAIMSELQRELSGGVVDFTGLSLEHASVIEDEKVCDALAMCNEAMMETFLEKAEIDLEQIKDAIVSRELFPCYFGSALKLDGVDQLIAGLKELTLEVDYGEEFAARVYKIGRDPQGNRLSYLKITGGSLKVKSIVDYSLRGQSHSLVSQDNSTEESLRREKVDQIRVYSGDKFETKNQVFAGSVCAVTGLSSTLPGTGLGAEESQEGQILTPVLNYRLILPSDVNPNDMLIKMKQLEEEDPELHILWKEELREIHAQLMGKVQIEVLTKLIWERYGVPVEFGQGNIVYKETIAKPVEGVGHFEPLRHYAEVQLLMEPGEPGSGIQIATAVPEDDLDLNWQRLICTHIEEREHIGVLTGSGLTDVKFTLVAGKAHLKHTEGGDFRQATYRAIRQGLKATESILLEPMYKVSLEVPTENVGKAMSDMQQRFGRIEGPEYTAGSSGEMALLKGYAPVATMQDYMAEVHSYTKGRGHLTLELAGYDVCHNSEQVIEEIAYDSEADTANPTGSVFCAHGAGFVVPWNQVPDYKHLEYVDIPSKGIINGAFSEKIKDDLISGEDGFAYDSSAASFAGASIGAKKKESQTAWELDQELQQIYAREFGMNRQDMLEYERKKWRKKSAGNENEYSRLGLSGAPRKAKHDKDGNVFYPKQAKLEDYLIVDGYNVIFALEEYKELANHNMDSAKGKLLDDLVNYSGYRKSKMIVVFDAYRKQENPEHVEDYHGISVVHTKTDMTADTYIEQTVHKLSDKAHVTVATNDGLEQLTILGQGALRMTARNLMDEMKRLNHESIKQYKMKQIEQGTERVTLADYMKK